MKLTRASGVGVHGLDGAQGAFVGSRDAWAHLKRWLNDQSAAAAQRAEALRHASKTGMGDARRSLFPQNERLTG